MICKKCGKEVDGEFCSNCGSRLKEKEPRKKLTKKQIMAIVIPIVVVAVLIAIIVPSAIVSSNIFRVGKVDKINIGDSREKVLKILGEPYEQSDFRFEYYSKDYLKLAKQIDDYYNSDLDTDEDSDMNQDIEDFDPDKDLNGDDEDKITKMEEELENMVYKYIVVEFDSEGKVESVFFDAEKCDSKEYKKVVDSYKITPNKVTRYIPTDITYSVKFTDKSFYKSTAQKGFIAYYALDNVVTWSDKWKSDYKSEVKVKENKDIIYMENEADILYLLDGNGILNIEGDTDNEVFADYSGWDSYKNNIKGLHIGQGITGSINSKYFLKNIEQITVDENNTKYKSEGNCIIEKDTNTLVLGCKTSIIPNGVTSIDESAFKLCESFENIKVDESNSNYSVENNLIIDKTTNTLVIACKSITSIEIPSSVTSIGIWAFADCSSLTSIEIPSSVTSIGIWAFAHCSSLTSIEIPSSVKSIGDFAFIFCDGLTSIEIPSSVTSIGKEAFYDNTGLTSVMFGENSQLESIGNSAFEGCSSLTNIVIPNSVTNIGASAFRDCSSLTIYCEASEKPSGWSSWWNDSSRPVVWNCTECGVTESGVKWGLTKEGVITIIAGYSGTSTEVIIPETINGHSVTSIGECAFEDCSNLTSIEIPNSVTSIGEYAFSGCSSLTNIEIPDSVTSIGSYAFEDCSSLTSIVIPNSVTNIGAYAFSDCSSLTIYCVAESEPSGWSSWWNDSGRPVVWGYKG